MLADATICSAVIGLCSSLQLLVIFGSSAKSVFRHFLLFFGVIGVELLSGGNSLSNFVDPPHLTAAGELLYTWLKTYKTVSLSTLSYS